MSEHCPTCGHALHPPRPARRIECAGGCGLWWYAGKGRPKRWCERCYPRHRSAMRNMRADPAPRLASAASGQGRGPEHISKPMGRVLEQIKGKVEG